MVAPPACKTRAGRLASRDSAWFCTQIAPASATSTAPTNATRVYDELREALLEGGIPPGERLRTAALAERFGTSRTPVREALVLLEGDGLVELEPRRGAIARGFAADDIAEIYDVRALLEPRAAALASHRIEPDAIARLREICDRSEAATGRSREAIASQITWNEELHRLIHEAAASPRLIAALRAVGSIPRAFRTAFWLDGRQRALSQTCHRELVAALAAGDAERAEATMRMHVVAGRAYLSEVTMHRTRGAAT
jgi:DNA-binding GntR family transcriptional regulator